MTESGEVTYSWWLCLFPADVFLSNKMQYWTNAFGWSLAHGAPMGVMVKIDYIYGKNYLQNGTVKH